MKKFIIASVISVVSLVATVELAAAKTALLCRGVFGEIVAPLMNYEAPLKAKGYTVVYGSFIAPPAIKPDVVISHSACADVAPTAYPKAKHFPLDGTWAGRGCPKGTRCENYYAPVDKLPFLVCCGGYPTRGSTKVYKEPGTLSFFIFAPGHVNLPFAVQKRVMNSIP